MKLIFLADYNNYYNRIYKIETSIQNYKTAASTYWEIDCLNWAPNDGVDTVQILNAAVYQGKTPNYMIASKDGTDIFQRWFVIDCAETRGGQYRVTLKRDVVADTDINTAPMFVEKAFVSDNDSFIYNQEEMSFNQIKSGEKLLKDHTGLCWVVGYVDRKYPGGERLNLKETVTNSYEGPFRDWAGYSYQNPFAYKPGAINPFYRAGNETISPTGTSLFLYWAIHIVTSTVDNYVYYTSQKSGNTWTHTPLAGTTRVSDRQYLIINTNQQAAPSTIYPAFCTWLEQNISTSAFVTGLEEKFGITEEAKDNYARMTLNFNNKTVVFDEVKDGDVWIGWSGTTRSDTAIVVGRPYTISVVSDARTLSITSASDHNSLEGTDFGDSVSRLGATFTQRDATGTSGSLTPYATVAFSRMKFSVTVANISDYFIDMPNRGDRVHLDDAPFDMFCMPINPNGSVRMGTYPAMTKEDVLSFCTEIANKLDKNCYDLQLLPYCPYDDTSTSTTSGDTITWNYTATAEQIDYIYKVSIGSAVGAILWCSKSTRTKTLSIGSDASIGTNITDKKQQSNTDFHRLVSPNGAGTFEFNVAKNNGLSTITANITYLPYSPFIGLHPTFGGLYGTSPGKEFRGLKCGGDYSLMYTSNAWENFKTSNKNYEAIFNREIENMDFNRSMQLRQEEVGGVLGILGATTSGAATGAMIGDGYGAIAGAAIGAVGGIIGQNEDKFASKETYTEQRNLKTDMYQYQLGNIKALPQSIARTTAYNNDNKYWPTLEWYTCSDEEKQAFQNKIKYNGMSVYRIGTLNDFKNNTYHNYDMYFKGKLIKSNSSEDPHFHLALAEELNKGVFI